MFYTYIENFPIDDIETSIELIDYFKNFSDWSYDYIELSGGKPNQLCESQFILVIGDNIWQFTNYYIRKIEEGEFLAIGAGSQAASACMHVGANVENTLKAVCKVDLYCSEPIKIFTVKRKHE